MVKARRIRSRNVYYSPRSLVHFFNGASLLHIYSLSTSVYFTVHEKILPEYSTSLDSAWRTNWSTMNSGKSNQIDVNPLNQGGALYDPPPCFGFFPLLKISLRNLYLAKLFVADAHCTNEKKIQHFCFTPSQSNFKYGSENRPWVRGLKHCPVNKKAGILCKFSRRESLWRKHAYIGSCV